MTSRALAERALWVAAAAGVLACWPLSDVTFDGYNLPKEFLLALAALGAAAAALQGRDAVSRCVWALFALTALSAVLSFNGWLAARAAALTLTGVVLFEATRALDADARERVLMALGYSVLALAAVAFIESQGLLPGLSREGRAPGATLGQRNAVAHVLVLGLPAVLHLASKRWAFRFGALLTTAVIVLTRCRAAWLGLFIVAVVWAVRSSSRRWVAAPAVGVILAALLPTRLAWTTGSPLHSTLVRLFDANEGSGLGRLVQWRASLGLVWDHPMLGVGPGNWMVAYPLVSPPGDPTFREGVVFSTGRLLTSDWVALVVERGAPALVVAVALLGFVAVKLIRTKDALTTVSLASLGALAVMGQLDSVVQVPSGMAVAALAIAVGVPRAAAVEAARGAWALRIALLAAAAQSAALLFAFRERALGTYPHLERGARIAPGDPVLRQTLAESYVLEGRCDLAAPHLDALQAQLPFHPAVKSLDAACPHSP